MTQTTTNINTNQLKERRGTTMAFQNPKGTRDYYPEDRAVWNWMADAFRKTAVSFGFQEVESPAFENLSVLCEKEGEETKRQIFMLEKRGDESFGLRFDLTVPFTRMFVQKQRELPKPVKWFGISRMWRYEQPQKGRLREFYQFSCELFGSPQVDADAQVVCLIIAMFNAVGLDSKDFVIRINNRNLLQGILEGLSVKDIDPVLVVIDKKDKLPPGTFAEELVKAGVSPTVVKQLQQILDTKELPALSRLKLNERAKQGLDNMKELFSLLDGKKEYLELDLSTARGLAYYTGTVFEAYDRSGKYRALCGGGRYDKMIKQFGGEDCPATGVAIGFATMELLLDEKMKLPSSTLGIDYYLVVISDAAKATAQLLAEKLRASGSSVDLDVMGRSLSKQMEYANKIRAKNVIVLGENEVKSKKAKIKNLESGEEREMKL